jgi:hypothetical protein
MTTEEEHLPDDERMTRIHFLGSHVTPSNSNKFRELVALSVESGTVDITSWTVEAVRVLLLVARERNLTITLKNGTRYSTPVKYPEGRMFDELVRLVMNDSDQ